MRTGIHVGNNVTKGAAKRLERTIKAIFKSGFENHVEQETLRAALAVVERAYQVANTCIMNSTIKSGK